MKRCSFITMTLSVFLIFFIYGVSASEFNFEGAYHSQKDKNIKYTISKIHGNIYLLDGDGLYAALVPEHDEASLKGVFKLKPTGKKSEILHGGYYLVKHMGNGVLHIEGKWGFGTGGKEWEFFLVKNLK